LMLRRSDFAGTSAWLRGAIGRPAPARAAAPQLDELRRAKARAARRTDRGAPPTSQRAERQSAPQHEASRPPTASPDDDPMERLRAARERARRRARGEE